MAPAWSLESRPTLATLPLMLPLLWLLALLPGPSVANPNFTFGFLGDGSAQATDTLRGITTAFAERNFTLQGLCANVTLSVAVAGGGSGPELYSQGLALATTTAAASTASGGSFVGFLGAVGTEAANVAANLSRHGLANIAPAYGSNTIQEDSVAMTATLRASQADEAVALVRFLRVNLSLELFGLLYDPKWVDNVTLSAVTQACARTGLPLMAQAPLSSSWGTSAGAGADVA
eukprot:RCo002543